MVDYIIRVLMKSFQVLAFKITYSTHKTSGIHDTLVTVIRR